MVLPAVSWAETDGTFTNLERRVQRAPKALGDPQSKAAPDWMILAHLAGYFDAAWAYADAQAVTAEIGQVVPQYAGLTWEALGDEGVQWDAAQAPFPFAYAVAEQAPLPSDGAGSLALVSGTVLYDDGALFRLTPHLRESAFGAQVALNPAGRRAARTGCRRGRHREQRATARSNWP